MGTSRSKSMLRYQLYATLGAVPKCEALQLQWDDKPLLQAQPLVRLHCQNCSATIALSLIDRIHNSFLQPFSLWLQRSFSNVWWYLLAILRHAASGRPWHADQICHPSHMEFLHVLRQGSQMCQESLRKSGTNLSHCIHIKSQIPSPSPSGSVFVSLSISPPLPRAPKTT